MMLKIEVTGIFFDRTKISLPANKIEGSDVLLQFSNSVNFNSISVNNWLTWLRETAEPLKLKIHLAECPISMISNTTTIDSFLPSKVVVESFYVPFYSDHTQESKQILLKRNIDFDENNLKIPKCLDSKGNEMEIDIIPETYFRFLKTKKKE